MKMSLIGKNALLAALGTTLLGGCVYRERVVYRQPDTGVVEDEVVVAGPPPAPIVEDVVVAPGPGYIWIGGSWVWRGHWVWERGRWARPPRGGAIWVPGRYYVRGGAHVYVRGHWR